MTESGEVRAAFISYREAAAIAAGVPPPTREASAEAFDQWLAETIAAELAGVAVSVADGFERIATGFAHAAAHLTNASTITAALAAEEGKDHAPAVGDTAQLP